jgi:hypothetical protein
MTEDLVRRTVEMWEAERKRMEVEQRKVAQEEEIKMPQARHIWQALGQWMKKYCEDCNAQAGENHLEFKQAESDQFDVVNHFPTHPDTLHVVFNPRTYTITYQRETTGWGKVADKQIEGEGKANGTFSPNVDGNQLLYTIDDTSMTVKQMGKRLTKALMPMLALE